MSAHYAFAIGYQDGLTGNTDRSDLISESFKEFYERGYEQGSSDDAFGEVNADLLKG